MNKKISALNDRIATQILEAYRRTYGYRKTYAGHYTPRDEPGESDSNPDVIRHNNALARQREREKRKKQSREQLKKNNKVPTKQGKPMFENNNEKVSARQTLGKSLAGQTFYNICNDDDRYYKTIYIRFNPFTNALQPMISNAIYGTPPDGMEEINPLLLSRLTRLTNVNSFRDY